MRKITLFLIIALSLWGCVTFTQSYKLGNKAEMNKNWDEAIKYYEQANLENPRESVYRLALFRCKFTASLYHLQEARKLVGQGKKEEALAEYNKALSYDPLNRAIAEEARSLTEEGLKKEEPKKERIEPPVKLKFREEKVQLKFVDASLRSIFQALGKHSQVNILFDETFRDMPFSIDLVDMDFEQAVSHLCLASRNFYRIVDERTIIVAPDNPQKRVQYELNAIKTFYLSNINAQEIQSALLQMLRTTFKVPNISVDKNLNSITVRDTPASIELAEKLIRVWDKPKGEVIIDLEIMEVSRIKLRQLGLNFDQNVVGLKYSGTQTTQDTGWMSLKGIDFSKSSNFQISLPVAFIQFLESDADTKIIAQPRLRGVADEDIKYIVGQKIPIPQTTFTPIAAGGVSQQPVVTFLQQDVGIDVKIKPRIHFEKEITLELEIKITSLGGTGYANIPIITTREVKNIIRLKDGETNLLAGLLKDEERKSLKGIPGIKGIPLLGSLFSSTEQTIEQTDVILTITPYIIRALPLDKEDLKPLWVELEGISSSGRITREFPEEELLSRRFLQEREQQEMERAREEEGQNQIFLNPANFELPQNREFRLSVNIRSSQEIGNMSLNLSYNAQVMKLKEVVEGTLIKQLGEKVPFLKNIDQSSGICTIGFSSPELRKGFKGTGSIAILVFESTGQGESTVSVTGLTANSPTGQAVAFQTSECRIVVR